MSKTQTITFGELSFSTTLPLGGPPRNRPTDYGYEVKYENISPVTNITRTSEPPGTSRPLKGAAVEGVPVQVVAQSEASTLHAIKKRCDHRPGNNVSDQFMRGHRELMDKIHERETITLDQGMIQAYLDEMSGTKRERLGALLDSMDFTLPGYTDKVVFAKSEALIKPEGSAPRVVYQGGDMYNLVMGSIMYYLSRNIASELSRTNPLNKGRELIYCVGMTADEIADIVHHTSGEAVENDFKNNDGTQPAAVRKHEAMFYYKLGAPKWFVREFAANTSVRVFTRYGVKGKVTGQRWSGEVTTTTGNGYVNACLSLAALQEAKIENSTTLIYGDDNLTYTSRDPTPLVKGFETCAESIGMKAEVVAQNVRENATFLRKRFVPSMTKTYPVPSFGRVLSKISVRANYNASVRDNDYMAGKLLSAAYEHRHIASLRQILLDGAQQLSQTPHLDMRNQAMAYKYSAEELSEMTLKAHVVDSDCLHTFLKKVYGINEDELIDCYRQITESILGFQYVNARRSKNTKDPTKLEPLLPKAVWSTAYESLVTVDVSI